MPVTMIRRESIDFITHIAYHRTKHLYRSKTEKMQISVHQFTVAFRMNYTLNLHLLSFRRESIDFITHIAYNERKGEPMIETNLAQTINATNNPHALFHLVSL